MFALVLTFEQLVRGIYTPTHVQHRAEFAAAGPSRKGHGILQPLGGRTRITPRVVGAFLCRETPCCASHYKRSAILVLPAR